MSQSSDARKKFKKLAKRARKKGWVVEPSGGGHLRWSHPDGGLVFSSASPSCPFAVKKVEAELKRQGIAI
jgi:predicted RNA binding protein YcfA (HicA-like mRNA interferase family)